MYNTIYNIDALFLSPPGPAQATAWRSSVKLQESESSDMTCLKLCKFVVGTLVLLMLSSKDYSFFETLTLLR